MRENSPKFNNKKRGKHDKNTTPFRGFVLFLDGGRKGIRTLAGLRPNGFQDRLVMTASISFRKLLSIICFFMGIVKKNGFISE